MGEGLLIDFDGNRSRFITGRVIIGPPIIIALGIREHDPGKLISMLATLLESHNILGSANGACGASSLQFLMIDGRRWKISSLEQGITEGCHVKLVMGQCFTIAGPTIRAGIAYGYERQRYQKY